MIKLWNNLSDREKRLALAVGVLVGAALLYMAVTPALNHYQWLDAEIERLENDLLNYTMQMSRRDAVDREFARIAEQHSIEWSAEEIHDGLRREIDRLTWRSPPPPDGIMTASVEPPGSGGRIVGIREIPEGQLSESGEGYREYQINFRTGQTSLPNIVMFLRRLQESPQALRVDSLQVTRAAPERPEVTAVFEVTRTVVDGIPEDVERAAQVAARTNMLDNPSFEEWDADASAFVAWNHENCEVAQSASFATAGEHALEARNAGSEGLVYQTMDLRAGESYILTADIAAQGPVQLRIMDMDSGQPFQGNHAIEESDLAHRYEIRFTVPGNSGQRAIAAPYFVLQDGDARLYLDNVSVERAR